MSASGRSRQQRLSLEASNAPECYCTRHRPRSGSHRSTVISAMDDPFAIGGLTGDNTDVVVPDDNDSDAWTAGVRADVGPISRERKSAVRLTEIPGHIRSAPCVCCVPVMMSLMWASISVDGKSTQQSCR